MHDLEPDNSIDHWITITASCSPRPSTRSGQTSRRLLAFARNLRIARRGARRASSAAPSMSRPPSRPTRPVRLGRYSVLAKIAGGGLSTLYLGRRTDDGRLVALKVVRHDLRGDE